MVLKEIRQYENEDSLGNQTDMFHKWSKGR